MLNTPVSPTLMLRREDAGPSRGMEPSSPGYRSTIFSRKRGFMPICEASAAPTHAWGMPPSCRTNFPDTKCPAIPDSVSKFPSTPLTCASACLPE